MSKIARFKIKDDNGGFWILEERWCCKELREAYNSGAIFFEGTDKGYSMYIMGQDDKLRVKFCPSCGAEIKVVTMKE